MTTQIIFAIAIVLGVVLLAFNYLKKNDEETIAHDHAEVKAFEAKKETPKMTAKPKAKKQPKKEVAIPTETTAKPKRKYNKKPKA